MRCIRGAAPTQLALVLLARHATVYFPHHPDPAPAARRPGPSSHGHGGHGGLLSSNPQQRTG